MGLEEIGPYEIGPYNVWREMPSVRGEGCEEVLSEIRCGGFGGSGVATASNASRRCHTSRLQERLTVVYWWRSIESFSSPGDLFRYMQFYDLSRNRLCITLSNQVPKWSGAGPPSPPSPPRRARENKVRDASHQNWALDPAILPGVTSSYPRSRKTFRRRARDVLSRPQPKGVFPCTPES